MRDRMSEIFWHPVTAASRYSGTPPYDHPVYKTTSLLRPYSFKPNVKAIESFYYFDDPVNATTSLLRPGFYGPTVVALSGFHCTLVSRPRDQETKGSGDENGAEKTEKELLTVYQLRPTTRNLFIQG